MKRELIKAVPPTPEHFYRRMDDVLEEIEDMQHMKNHRHKYAVLIAVLTLLVALAGLAYAASQSGMMARLFPGTTPPPEVEQAIIKSAITQSENGVTLTLDEYLFDGVTLNVDWTVDSTREKPVFYLTEWIRENESKWSPNVLTRAHLREHYGMFEVLDGTGTDLGMGRKASDYMRVTDWNVGWEELPDKPFDVILSVHAFETSLEPVLLPGYDFNDETQDQAFEEAGKIGIISAYRMAKIDSYSKVRGIIEERYVRDYPHESLQAQDYGDTGLMMPVATLTARITIDPKSGTPLWHTEPKERSHTYDGGRIEIVQMDFSATITRVEYNVYPDVPIEGDYEDGLWGLVLDEDGTPMNLSGFVSGGHGGYVTLIMEGNPSPKAPAFVTLFPSLTGEESSKGETEGIIPNKPSIRIELNKVTSLEQNMPLEISPESE